MVDFATDLETIYSGSGRQFLDLCSEAGECVRAVVLSNVLAEVFRFWCVTRQ